MDESSDEDGLMGLYADLIAEDDKTLANVLRSNLKGKVLDGVKTETAEEKKKKDDKRDLVFLNYGTGIQNYFNLQKRMIKLFCGLSIIAIFQMLIYKYFNGYNYTSADSIYA